jgi:hypothetical protein
MSFLAFDDSLPPLRTRINVMESTIEIERIEEETSTFNDEFPDEALEAAASQQRMTFTFSYNPYYCRFC